MNLKDNLITRIEAYAEAKRTNSEYLQSLIAKDLQTFLENIEIVNKSQTPPIKTEPPVKTEVV